MVVDGGEASEELLAQYNVNLVWLTQGSNLFACYNAIQMAFLEHQELQGVVQRLLAAHFSNQGLQYLIEEAAIALQNPIVVVDPTYHYTAHHLGNLPEEDTRLAQVMVAEIANETILEEAVAYIRDSQIDSQIARSKGPYEQYNTILCCNTMTLAVMVRGVCLAHVMMMEHQHPFTELDREAFVRLAQFVGQELQKSELWGPTSGELGSYFLENLLNDRSPSAAVTRRRLKTLNFHPKPQLYAVCLHAPGEGLSQYQAEHIAGQLRPVLHHSLYTRHHQQLVAILSRDPDEGLSERTERKLKEVAALNGLTVGISNCYRTMTETRMAYEQARAAIRYGTRMRGQDDTKIVFFYRDVAYVQGLEFAGRHMNMLSLCHPALLSLMEYDENHSGELMETLFCYLQTACSTARAAQALNLHKNTMLYRLGRIKEVLGINLEKGEELFKLQVSFRALMNLGLFTPKIALR
ncbi:MAG: helix-turn-helix domain-containing protein [Atopobiaceae bacterium]|nr:helix-turn-helix domain-containing protein [Atopobiaceae bacterium]